MILQKAYADLLSMLETVVLLIFIDLLEPVIGTFWGFIYEYIF